MFALDSIWNTIQPFSLLLRKRTPPQKKKKPSLQVVNLPFSHIDCCFHISARGQLTNLFKKIIRKTEIKCICCSGARHVAKSCVSPVCPWQAPCKPYRYFGFWQFVPIHREDSYEKQGTTRAAQAGRLQGRAREQRSQRAEIQSYPEWKDDGGKQGP